MGSKNSSLNYYRHRESGSINFLVPSHKIWNKVERKMWIEVNSYKERDDRFWREMLTHIGEVYIINNYYNITTLYYIGTEGRKNWNGSGFDWNIYNTISWIYTGTEKTTSFLDISTGNTAKICITLHENNPVARPAVFFVVDAINKKFNDHETELWVNWS